MFTVKLFYVSVFATYWFNTSFGVKTISKKVNLPLLEEITITSPGYPWTNYERDTIYRWMVTAPDVTEEIHIRIDLDIHQTAGFACYDYLKIEEITNDIFGLFKQCGRRTAYRVASGCKLMIILFSNFDIFTGKGFRLRLKVSKISTRPTTLATTFRLSKIITTAAAIKTSRTTSTKNSYPQKSKTRIKTTLKIFSTPSTKEITTRKQTKPTFPESTATHLTTSKEITSEVLSSSPRKTIKTTFLHSTAIQPATSTEIATEVLSSSPGKTIKTTFLDSTASQPATSTEITTEVLSSEPVTWDRSMSPLPSTRGIMGASTVLSELLSDSQQKILNSTSTTLNAVTSTETTSFVLSREIVVLMVGIVMVEVTIIIVGILAVKRFRQKKNNTTRRSKENVVRPVSRKTVCSIDNVYSTIPEEEFDENPYKELSEGVYDTTSKRRSHVNGNWNEYSRGSFYSRLFRSSKVSGGRPVEETHPMFSTFRDSKKETK
ncbi:uncharacterized protein LOC134272224 [Saccostrea cucullata]|uniref:uncharacterized protein LOC134272224 n=1 Tax=Saccostrea cuccullata TaxID=36930 RepID=UPI002ED1508C